MRVEIINPLESLAWDHFVAEHPLATIYHLSAWAQVLDASFLHIAPRYFVLRNEAGGIEAGLPLFLVKSRILGNRLVSIPFTPHCDPLVQAHEQWKELTTAAIEYLRDIRGNALELRMLACPDFAGSRRWSSDTTYRTYELELTDRPESLWQNFHRDCVQRAVKKAMKREVRLVWGESVRDLHTFCELLVSTRRAHGFPPQPFRFFQNMWHELYPLGKIALALAVVQKRVIGGVLLLKHRDRVQYEFVASDKRGLEMRPNHFLVWESIQMACREGYRVFDFGKTPDDNPGLVQFKERWGAVARPLLYCRYSTHEQESAFSNKRPAYRWLQKYFRHAPAPLSKWSGALVYRHIG
ncbi:MAG: lipid II:glycine glycyltransferase FemX [Candidatus Zhuqueibacterota bacterium]